MVWQVMATMASKLDSLADQGSMAIVTSNTALHMHPLKFPTQFLSSKGGEQRRILCQTLVEQGKIQVAGRVVSGPRSVLDQK